MNVYSSFHRFFHLIGAAIALGVSSFAQAQLAPGAIDTAFAASDAENIGRARGNFTQVRGYASATQPDGKIVVASACSGGSPAAPFCVTRFNANGSVDNSFGSNGVASTSFPGSLDASVNHVTVMRNGHIIVAGLCGIAVPPNSFVNRLCYARFTSNGTLTGGTAGSGRVIVDSLRSFEGNVVRVVEGLEGRLAIAGTCRLVALPQTRICVSGFTAADQPDGGFNSGSERDFTHFEGSTPYQTTLHDMVASRGDQGLYFAASCDSPSGTYMCVGKLSSGGIFSSDFASGGFAFVVNGIAGSANSLLEQYDGKVVIAGGCAAAGGFLQYCVGRFNANGTVDTTFGSGGSSRILLSSFTGTSATRIVQQPDGKLVAFSYCETAPASPQLCVLRHEQNGSLDSGFGFAGIARQPYPPFSNFISQVLRSDGNLVIAGTCSLDVCVRQTIGGPLSGKQCTLDIDGDGVPGTPNDYWLAMRAAMGFTGAAALQGANFPAGAARNTWPAIRTYLASQCGMPLAP